MAATPKILELNAFDMRRKADLEPTLAELVARRRRSFGPNALLFYERPIAVTRAEGVWLYGPDGERYLDVYNNVPSVGHCHPHVVEAVSRQLGKLNTHTRYLYDIVYTYAEKLLATMPAEVSNIVFTCTGSESSDLALRIARCVTDGSGFIVTENAYHGNTAAVTEISPAAASEQPRGEHVALVPAPDTYRRPADNLGDRFAREVQQAIDALQRKGIRLAGIIVDTIFSSDGIYADPAGFLAPAIAAVRAAGGVYIADEVQPGFGRTGEKMWGFERHGVMPDIVVMGKPMGNGFPMGGVTVRPDLLEVFGAKSGYFNTFGGNPVAAAAGIAVLEVIEEEGLMANAAAVGAYMLKGMRDLSEQYPAVGDVRGAGLFFGVEFSRNREAREPDRDMATRVVNGMRERNVLIGTAGRHGNVLKIRPPLCFSREHADIFLETFADVLKACL